MGETKPLVDVAICTIGRPTLLSAAAAALCQTYPNTHVVVLADGEEVLRSVAVEQVAAAAHGNLFWRWPREPFGHGNGLKSWWLHDPECAPFVRFLDDDDWMPPQSVEIMMSAMADDVGLVLGRMIRWFPDSERGNGRTHLCEAALKPHHATTGTMLMRRDAVRQAERFDPKMDDWTRAKALATVGRVATVDAAVCWCDRREGRKKRGLFRNSRLTLEREMSAESDPVRRGEMNAKRLRLLREERNA